MQGTRYIQFPVGTWIREVMQLDTLASEEEFLKTGNSIVLNVRLKVTKVIFENEKSNRHDCRRNPTQHISKPIHM